MDSLQLFVLAVIQGLTEFLPISSSAHLVLLPKLLGWPDQGLVFDAAVHIGSLLAVLGYFRVEVKVLFRSWLGSFSEGVRDRESLLAWWILIATIPAIVVGFLLQGPIEVKLRLPWVVALASIFFGLLLWYADIKSIRSRDEYQLNLKDVVIIGCFQVLSLIPGTSRSGITITLGLFLGLTRTAAARFSFLLAMPVIFASGVLQTVRMATEVSPITWSDLLLGIVVAAVSAALCIHYFLQLIEKLGLWPFVVYRVLLGLAILIFLG